MLLEPDPTPAAVILATGSEVAIALDAQKMLVAEGAPVRVVSMPSTTVFDREDDSYRASVLPPNLLAVAVEAGSSELWRKYVGRSGAVVGIDRFGESAPAGDLYAYFGITADRIVEAVKGVVAARPTR